MNYKPKHTGFSLTEVLMAVGILAVGLIFIAGLFPVAIRLSTIATEQTISAVAADEAFAKIRLYGIDVSSLTNTTTCVDFNDVVFGGLDVDPDEFAYPSTGIDISQKQYFWSALCRRVQLDTSDVQVTVFISRKIGAGTRYWDRNLVTGNLVSTALAPVPVRLSVSQAGLATNELLIIDILNDGIYEETFINDGYTIVDNATGEIYRVLERYPDNPATTAVNEEQIILLDRPWLGGQPAGQPGWQLNSVWVVPPPVGGGRGPCIAVYQKVIRF